MSIKLQDIIDKAGTLIDGITTGAGYHLNLGSYNTTDRPEAYQVTDWSVNVQVPSEEFLQEQSSQFEDHLLTLDVEITKTGVTAATQTEIIQALHDVRKAFGADRTWANLIINITPAGFTKPKSELGEYISGMIIAHFTIQYRTTTFQES